jgi:hypothetical protein
MDYCRDKTHQSHWCLLLAIAGGRLGSSSKMNSVSLKGESVRVGERSIYSGAEEYLQVICPVAVASQIVSTDGLLEL